MKAIILAAGKSSRLYPITLNKPKGLLEIGDRTILDRLIRQFRDAGINEILIVVGYKKEKIKRHLGHHVRYSEYDDFNMTNNLHTLWSVRHELDTDVIISFSDLVLHDDVITKLIQSQGDIVMTVDTKQVLDGTMRVEVDNNKLLSIKTTTSENASGNFIGIAKLNSDGCKRLISEMKNLITENFDDYFTLAIDNISRRGEIVNYCDVSGLLWREIDTEEEYNEARLIEHMFNQNR
jgi:L-glutamine-phosphate cytidylyltransferase